MLYLVLHQENLFLSLSEGIYYYSNHVDVDDDDHSDDKKALTLIAVAVSLNKETNMIICVVTNVNGEFAHQTYTINMMMMMIMMLVKGVPLFRRNNIAQQYLMWAFSKSSIYMRTYTSHK